MPPLVFTMLAAIQAAIQAAPQVKELVIKGKDFIASLFTAKLITKEQQNQLFKRVDEISEAFKNGKQPPHWDVEPDPE